MDLNRRDFTRLSVAAFGGLLAGCGGGEPPAQPSAPAAPDEVAAKIHACRGLNSCKGLGAGGENACAGLGTCATAKHHDCATQNECKNQGGCGANPGYNECKGQGGCMVPIHEGAWEQARKTFESKMQAANKEFGDAPPRPEAKPE